MNEISNRITRRDWPAKEQQKMNSKLDNALAAAQSAVPDCVAVGYVDMELGMRLGMKTTDNHPAEVLEYVAGATANMFEGNDMRTIESLFRKSRGGADAQKQPGSQKMVIMQSDAIIHVFRRCKANPMHAVVFVCRNTPTGNIGMIIAKSNGVMEAVEKAAA